MYLCFRTGTTESELQARSKKAALSLEDMDEEQRAIIRAQRREARKVMERERKKAVRNAYRRLRDAKKKPGDVSVDCFVLSLSFKLPFSFRWLAYLSIDGSYDNNDFLIS